MGNGTINNLEMVTTSICKIPPNLPLLKVPIDRDLAKRGKGRFSNAYVNSIMRLLIMTRAFPLISTFYLLFS
jgi:hypothetical protein